MINAHERFLLTGRMHIIAFVWIVLATFLLLNTAALDLQTEELQYYRESLMNEYLFQGFIIVKLFILSFGTFLWFYSEVYNEYDVYLYVRFPPLLVSISKWWIVTLYTIFVGFIITSIFIVLWMLYPGLVQVITVLEIYGRVVLLIVYYSGLHLFCKRVIAHVSGIFVPFILYLVGMILVDTNHLTETFQNGYNYIQLFSPDIVYFNNQFVFLFGDVMVLIAIVVSEQIVIHILRKQDWL